MVYLSSRVVLSEMQYRFIYNLVSIFDKDLAGQHICGLVLVLLGNSYGYFLA